MKDSKKLLICILSLMLLNTIIISQFSTVSALSKNKKALRKKALIAYSKVLTNKQKFIAEDGSSKYLNEYSSSDCSFAIIDMNNDGIKELMILADNSWIWQFMYINNQVKCRGHIYHSAEKFYTNKKLIRSYAIQTGIEIEMYSRFTDKLHTTTLCKYIATDGLKNGEYICHYKYYVKGKKVSKAKYNAYKKKLLKNAKETKYKFIKNTESARRKYLKG